MDIERLESLLGPSAASLSGEVRLFDEIDSTNAEALRRVKKGQSETGLLIAKTQTAGRGRRGREWLSPDQAGLYFSFYKFFDLPAESLQALSLVTALSVQSALEKAAIKNLQLKWPNDLLHEKKKLAGILLELNTKEGRNCLVFGIGINLTLPQETARQIDRPVTDLSSIADELPEVELLLAGIINSLCENLQIFEAKGFQPFTQQWNKLDCYINHDIVIESAGSRTIGKSLGVDNTGALVLNTAAGEKLISGGEIFPSLREVTAQK